MPEKMRTETAYFSSSSPPPFDSHYLVNRIFTGRQDAGEECFSPSITFFMYAPSGIAKITRIARYNPYCKIALIAAHLPS